MSEGLWHLDGDRYIGVSESCESIVEVEMRFLPDRSIEVIDIRETPLPAALTGRSGSHERKRR